MTVPRITLIFGPICRGEPDDCVMHVIKELYDSVDGNSVYPFGVIQIRPQDQRIQTNMIETALGPRPSYIGPKQNPESRFEEWTHVLDTLVDKELTAVASLRYHCTLLESSFSSSPQRPSGALTRIRAKIERARAVCNASMAEDGKSFLLTRLHPNDFEGIAYANEDSDDDDDDDEDGDGEGVTAGGQQAQFEFLMTVMLGVLGPMFEAQSHQGGMEDDGEARGTVDNLVGNIRTLSALGGLGSGGRLRIGPDGVRFFPHGQEPDDDVNINDNKNDDGGGGEVQDGEQASSVNVLAVESGDGSNSKRMKQSKESDSEEDA
ncbi:hypothetical protein BCR33DRAFT_712476 [Rhizoclosmatium globosum]|uniref:Uncharacterized protein n=1 Tax=Rhizoclosmatium globosum TaxID=329046 RepID=A0A1Y2CWQ3_9FUNG|nr:hypothetical protein BCR33DRAFT_712476 [Rhizoclosmatium globosum]|eukprot:ORY51417.1 hypothetical protein BCR33DRAFT_712476 [Rhizoclosmatium globosum]